jgi:acyl transferase domain-containing protein/acyl carrier protein
LNANETSNELMAIIGVGCLFPGAGDFGAYWANICNKVDGISDVPPTHWDPADYLDPDPKAPDHTYAARGGFLSPVAFNPAAYGIAPNSIEATDTSQLLGLMVAEQALKDAGYAAAIDRKRVGCILGVTGTLELVIPLGARLGHPVWRRALEEAGVAKDVADDVVQRIADSYVPWQEQSFPGLLGNVVAGRIANRLDLGGTNCVVDAACASSLSAIHLAALELQTGRADMVLTGGIDTFNDIFMYMCFSKTPALSPTGNAKPFDAAGDGTILGEGLGVVLLKRLRDARRDGDKVYAVLRGIGASSDGKGNAVYAPKAEGQMAALRQAYEVSGVTPDTIELVEAHGTGTRVGDAAEVAALTEVYRASGRSGSWCALGSVKSQIGHTKAAAGAAGLIKAVAALYHKVLPPTIKVETPLPALESGDTPFYVNTEKRPWLPSESHPRRAAVSAFGFGGSNFHCVVEEADPAKREIDWDGEVQILNFQDATPEGIALQLAKWLADLPWEQLRVEAARTRGVPRSGGCRLLVVIQRGRTDLPKLLTMARDLLKKNAGKPFWHAPDGVFFGRGAAEGKTALLFPGQGAQYVGMLRDLACHFAAAHEVLAEATRIFAEEQGTELREPAAQSQGERGTTVPRDGEGQPPRGAIAPRSPWLRAAGSPDSAQRLSDYIYPHPAFTPEAKAAQDAALRATNIAQPALGAVSLGAWRVLEMFGATADAAAGHSYGELTALCAAGRLGLAAFHSLSRLRGRLMADAAKGGNGGTMLAVFAPQETIAAILRDEHLDLVLANKNAPQQTVLSGRADLIDKALSAFKARQVRAQKLSVAAAFHSPLVAEAQAPLRAALEGAALDAGRLPVYANTTAQPYPADAAAARDLLAGQLARPVEFVAEVERLYHDGVQTFLEVGPGARLTGLIDAILGDRDHQALALDASSGQRSGFFDLACCLAWLASLGQPIRLALWDDGEQRLRELPPEDGRPAFTVTLSGANYVKPKPKRPPAPRVPAAPTVPSPPVTGVKNPTMNGNSPPPPQPPAPVIDGSALTQALQITRESLAALQRMQEQTAHLHRQFLDGQDTAHRTVHLLVEQQQRLLQAALGLPASPLPALPPVVAPASAPPTPAPVAFPAPPAPPVSASPPIAAAPPVGRVTNPPGKPGGLETRPTASTPPPAPTASSDRVEQILMETIAEKTGYPPEMLELDMALDADLGIDSIKRVEILSALQERLPEAPAIKPEHLGTLHNLRQIVAFLSSSTNGHAPAVEAKPQPAAEKEVTAPSARPFDDARSAELAATLERSVVGPEPLDMTRPRAAVRPLPGAEILVSDDDPDLARTLEERLKYDGYRPRLVSLAGLPAEKLPAALGGLVIVAPSDGADDAFLKHALFALKAAGPALRRAGQQSAALFVTISRMDGAFGLAGNPQSAIRNSQWADGGLAGLCKTASHEWPEVRCKAMDLAGDFAHAEDAASALVEEIFLAGPLEVGVSRYGRCTPERHVRPLPPGPLTPPLQPGEVVVVSGARGVTAEVAVALARAYRPTLVLLGRSESPQPEPNWIATLQTEPDIKRELARQPGATPKAVGEQYRAITAGREVRQTLERIAAVGAAALYRQVDIRDAEAVAAVLADVRRDHGPVRGVIHGAGVLADAKIEDKTPEQFQRVYETKVGGLRVLLQAVAADDLRVLVLFSSSTGRFGRAGQVDYAIANEVLNKAAQKEARRPGCRVVSVNWGPWDGGMVTPALKKLFAQEGIGLIGLEAGAEYLVRELGAADERDVEIVILGGAEASHGVDGRGIWASLPPAFERVLDLNDYPILGDHVFDGRPVLPMVLTLEWLAHGALHQNPGLAFHGCNDLRVLHGVILEEAKPVTVRVGAGKAVRRDGFYLTPVELRTVNANGREVLCARAEVVLTTPLPAPPSDHFDAAPLMGRKYPHSLEKVYGDLLFHGREFQGIAHVEGWSDAGIVAAVRIAPAPDEWIRRPLRQRWLADPLALDSSFQLLILWTLEKYGALNLPCFAARYRQYRRTFPADGVRALVRVTKHSDLHAVADIDYHDAAGQLVARIEGYECVMDASLQRAFRRRFIGVV